MKALGTGVRGVGWREIEILPDRRGKPLVYLHGRAEEARRDDRPRAAGGQPDALRRHGAGLRRRALRAPDRLRRRARRPRRTPGQARPAVKWLVMRPLAGVRGPPDSSSAGLRPRSFSGGSGVPRFQRMKLVTAAQMREIEAAAFAAGATPEGLMETAGRLVAETVAARLGNARAKRIVVLVGPGNNGGDGLVAARYLHDMAADVRVYLLAPRTDADPNFRALQEREVDLIEPDAGVLETPPACRGCARRRDHRRGPGHRPQPPARRPLRDCPGCPQAATRPALRRRPAYRPRRRYRRRRPSHAAADVTLTFGYSKLGLHLLPGAGLRRRGRGARHRPRPRAGRDASQTEIMTAAWARAALPDRPLVSNKGSFGRVHGRRRLDELHRRRDARLPRCAARRRRPRDAGGAVIRARRRCRSAAGGHLHAAAGGRRQPDASAADAVLAALPGYDVLLSAPASGSRTGRKRSCAACSRRRAGRNAGGHRCRRPEHAGAPTRLARSRSAPQRRPDAAPRRAGPPGRLAAVADVQSHRLQAARERAAGLGSDGRAQGRARR